MPVQAKVKEAKRKLVLVRHGERLDDRYMVSDEERARTTVLNDLDIPLSLNGKNQAVLTGKQIAKQLSDCDKKEQIRIYSSPYLRCI